jgi:MFS family permease
MLLLGLMMAGASTVDTITATMLPITARHFTDNIWFIGVLVALNRVCGFLVQPYAAWASDSHSGPGGRRRPFLLAAWPAVFLSLGLLGVLPYVVPADQQHAWLIIAVVFVVNLAMQAAVDVCYGAGDPMYGDVFPSRELGRAHGLRMVINATAGLGMTSIFVPLADVHEFWPYAGAMGFVALSYAIVRWRVRESLPPRLPVRSAYNPLKPLSELRDPRTRNVALCGSAVLVVLALTEMLHALFVTETLGFSKTVLGGTTAAALAIGFLMPYPVGMIVDRVGPRPVLIAGFALVAAVEGLFVFWVDDFTSLMVALVAFKVAWVLMHLPMVPLIFRGAPPERRGAIFAAVQTARAGAASVAVIVVGILADATGSYRICYFVAGLVCLIGLLAALRLGPAEKSGPVLPALA